MLTRHEESTPADFLAQSGGAVLDYADGGDNQEIETEAERSGQQTNTEKARKHIGGLLGFSAAMPVSQAMEQVTLEQPEESGS